MGRVYLALSPDGRVVAIKVIHQQHVADPMFRNRFRREVEAARRVSGAYTAAVMDADAEAELPWLATVYVPGPSLRAAVRTHGPLPILSVHALAVGLAAALREVHRAGLIHRDLTPANVLLTDDGPRVIDFGITRAVETGAELTGTGLLIGSPGFMSPEQVEGRDLSPASDVFSLGATLYFAAVGTGPFGKVSSASLLYRVVHTDPLLGELPSELLPIIEPCLARKPEARPSSEQLLDRLGSVRGGLAWLPGTVRDLIERQNEQLRILRDGAEPVDDDDADVTARVDRPSRHAPVTRPQTQPAHPGQSHPNPPRWVPGPGHPADPGGSAAGARSGSMPERSGAGTQLSPLFGPPGADRARNSNTVARYVAIALSLITVVTVAVVSLIAATNRGRQDAGGSPGDSSAEGSEQTADPPEDQPMPTDASAGEQLPDTFHGEWTGWVMPIDEDPDDYFHAVLDLGESAFGDAAGSVLDFMADCTTDLELTGLTEDTATFSTVEPENQDEVCPRQPETTTLTLDDDVIYYQTTEPASTSILTRPLAEIPEELRGVWVGTVEGARYGDSEATTEVDTVVEITGGAVDEAELRVHFDGDCHHVSEIVFADPNWIVARHEGAQPQGCPSVPARENMHLLDPDGAGYNGTAPTMEGQLDNSADGDLGG
ncbi:serine/threonine protein kinase [Actinoalloteichus hymeniacidonis]|nr:serine/threonine protein kinase [Actinoalloteichus hymeniacidonis]